GNIPATDHDNALGELLKLHEGIAGDRVLGTRKIERNRVRTRGNHDGAALDDPTFNGNRVRCGEASAAVNGFDALLGEVRLALLRYGIGESAFEGDQLLPVDAQFASNATAVHPAPPINGLGPANQHFLGIAAAQGAGSAERPM